MDIDAIQTLFAEKNIFSNVVGIDIAELAPGSATCTMVIRDAHRNPFGTVNAGAIYTLAETAFGAAANSHGAATVAVNLSISYLKPATSGTLTAKAEEISAGGRMASYSVKVFDDAGELIADVQAMGYRTKKSLEELV
ncbi:MAG: PaaI family thioesterase [Pseudodesulfovibrio sp.]